MGTAPLREAELDALMARLASGDREAFDPLYAALRPRALSLVTMRLGATAAPDVTQSALLAVFARASEFDAGRPVLPWFYAILANEIRSARRRDQRLVPTEIDEGALVDEGHVESDLVVRELDRALALAIDRLDDASAEAIRALLGRAPMPPVSAPTFRKRLSRAYAKLRLLLGGHDVG